MTVKRKKILFILYVMLTCGVLIYVLFPADGVKNHLVNRMSREIPDARVSIGSLKLRFPPALSLNDIAIIKEDVVVFEADSLVLFPKWRSLLSGTRAIGFKGQAYSGMIRGTASPVKGGDMAQWSANGVLSGIQLSRIPSLGAENNLELTGSLSGSFSIDAISRNQAAGTGTVVIDECGIIPAVPYYNVDRLDFSRIEADLTFSDNRIDLNQSDFRGNELDAAITGSIFMATPMEQSDVKLDIYVTPQRAFLSKLGPMFSDSLISSLLSDNNGLNLNITGSLANPGISLGSGL